MSDTTGKVESIRELRAVVTSTLDHAKKGDTSSRAVQGPVVVTRRLHGEVTVRFSPAEPKVREGSETTSSWA